MSPLDPVSLAQALIRCPSVTPNDGGVLAVLEAALTPLGFACHRLRFEEDGAPAVENLYARIGTQGPNFCFAGHTDVVPPGDAKLWKHDPFAAVIENGMLYGRGAVDMKSAIACFAAAASRYLAGGKPFGAINMLITKATKRVRPTSMAPERCWHGSRRNSERFEPLHCRRADRRPRQPATY